jgi:hypothetical protein
MYIFELPYSTLASRTEHVVLVTNTVMQVEKGNYTETRCWHSFYVRVTWGFSYLNSHFISTWNVPLLQTRLWRSSHGNMTIISGYRKCHIEFTPSQPNYLNMYFYISSSPHHDNSVSIVTKLQAEWSRIRGSSPGRATEFSLLHSIQTSSGSHPVNWVQKAPSPGGERGRSVRIY